MASDSENNGFLYFLVGGLVVAAAIAGFVYMDGRVADETGAPTVIERTERTIERTTDDDDSARFEMRVDENGASATTTNGD